MRMMTVKTAMLVVAIFLALSPTGVWAYSYGSADSEDVAETFKLVVSSLGQSPADWDGALAAHKARRSEIASHFGESVAVTLDKNFASRKAAQTISNYKSILVMNIDRRFENAVQSIDDYAKAKLLLAKAKATFDTLAPYAEAKLSASKMDGIKGDFDKALDAIGNPGLFGVGQKDADKKALEAAVNSIYSTIKPFFPYTAYKEPVKEPAGTGTVTKPKPGTGTTTKPAAPAEPGKVTTGQDTNAAKDDAVKEPAAESPVNEPAKPGDNDVKPAGDDSGKPADDTAVKPVDEDQQPAAGSPDTPVSSDEPAAANNQSADAGQAADSTADQAVAETIDGTKVHAPMQHEDRTNPAVTIGVIGGIVVIGGGAVWWARRKGFF
ncbi:hypothetical protein ACFPYJ_01185 [Paenibacillus solisilvae]|uniref:LPXTG cell wall anchor domain-containing protein n=1 Tax=Paenibacillus solisilvae TaxID=2486751 RepID=A0ABW0VS10_9BACL